MDRRHLVVAAVSSIVAAFAARASAQGCPRGDRPVVVLRAEKMEAPFAAELGDHLRSALAARGMELCVGEGPGVATLEIVPASEGVAMTVFVRDEITDKRVSRDVDVHSLPSDARPLAVADAADELLRASWAEILLWRSMRRTRDVPRPIVEAVERPRDEHEARFAAAAGVGAEVFSSGHAQIGPDVELSYHPWKWLGAVGAGGVRASANVESRHGTIATSAIVSRLGLTARAQLGERWRIGGGPLLVGGRLAFDGTPAPGFVARTGSAYFLYAAIDARTSVVLARPVYASLALNFGAPIRSARAIGTGETAHRVDGLLLGGELVIGLEW